MSDKTNVPEQSSPREYLHTVQAGAWLPLLQASITGVVIGISVTGLFFTLDIRHPETPGLIAGLFAWAVTWLLLQRHWYSLTALEKLTGRDLNHDGVIGQPPAPQHEVRVRVTKITPEGHWSRQVHSLPASREQLQTLAEGLLQNGRPFTHREWSGPGAPFSDGEFRNLRAEMIRRGLAEPASDRDARKGFVLTDVGKKVMEAVLSPSPTPEDDVL